MIAIMIRRSLRVNFFSRVDSERENKNLEVYMYLKFGGLFLIVTGFLLIWIQWGDSEHIQNTLQVLNNLVIAHGIKEGRFWGLFFILFPPASVSLGLICVFEDIIFPRHRH